MLSWKINKDNIKNLMRGALFAFVWAFLVLVLEINGYSFKQIITRYISEDIIREWSNETMSYLIDIILFFLDNLLVYLFFLLATWQFILIPIKNKNILVKELEHKILESKKEYEKIYATKQDTYMIFEEINKDVDRMNKKTDSVVEEKSRDIKKIAKAVFKANQKLERAENLHKKMRETLKKWRREVIIKGE